MIPIDKKYKVAAGVIIILLVGVSLWYFFGSGIQDNGSGADDVRTKLSEAADHNKSAAEHAENIESGLGRSENAITDSLGSVERMQERNRELETGLSELKRINSESESIIRSVRERGQAGD